MASTPKGLLTSRINLGDNMVRPWLQAVKGNKKTPLEHVVDRGNLPAPRYLFDHVANRSRQGEEGATVLHLATKNEARRCPWTAGTCQPPDTSLTMVQISVRKGNRVPLFFIWPQRMRLQRLKILKTSFW